MSIVTGRPISARLNSPARAAAFLGLRRFGTFGKGWVRLQLIVLVARNEMLYSSAVAGDSCRQSLPLKMREPESRPGAQLAAVLAVKESVLKIRPMLWSSPAIF